MREMLVDVVRMMTNCVSQMETETHAAEKLDWDRELAWWPNYDEVVEGRAEAKVVAQMMSVEMVGVELG